MSWGWVNWSNAIWSVWIGIFLVLELTGGFRVVPWRTLSETVWIDEIDYPVLNLLVGGFLVGLILHFLNRTPLALAIGLGIGLALVSHLIDHWPKW